MRCLDVPKAASAFATLSHNIREFAGLEPSLHRPNIQRRLRRRDRLHDEQLPVSPAYLNLPLSSRLIQQTGKTLPSF